MLCGSIVKRSTGGDEFVLGSGWWEIAIGSKASIEASVGGDYAKDSTRRSMGIALQGVS